jgi:hypothetical protein
MAPDTSASAPSQLRYQRDTNTQSSRTYEDRGNQDLSSFPSPVLPASSKPFAFPNLDNSVSLRHINRMLTRVCNAGIAGAFRNVPLRISAAIAVRVDRSSQSTIISGSSHPEERFVVLRQPKRFHIFMLISLSVLWLGHGPQATTPGRLTQIETLCDRLALSSFWLQKSSSVDPLPDISS